MKTIYLDNAATTPVSFEVFAAIKPYFLKIYGNASEPHLLGIQAKQALEEARMKVAKFLGAQSNEIIFTSCATESINLAHKGLVEMVTKTRGKPNIITSTIEHKAVLESCKHLSYQGLAEITYLPVDKFGLISLSDLEKAIQDNTALVSIMFVNNEVGTIQPIIEIGQLLKSHNSQHPTHHIYFHTDATQAIQYLNCQVDGLGVDLLSLTGHKIYAPKGVGALYIRNGTPLLREMDGGSQEGGFRAGTENVPYIVGLGQAMELASKNQPQLIKQTTQLRDLLINKLVKIPGVKLTGHPSQRAPHIASFLVEGVEGEALVLLLSNYGICVSSGSACTSHSLSPSHVLTAMGIPPEASHGSLRISLGKKTSEKEINQVIITLPKIIDKLRKMSPKL